MKKSTLGLALCAVFIFARPAGAADGGPVGGALGTQEASRAANAAADLAAPNRTIQLLLQMQSAGGLPSDGDKPLPDPAPQRALRNAIAAKPAVADSKRSAAEPAKPAEPSHWTAAALPVQAPTAALSPTAEPDLSPAAEKRARTGERPEHTGSDQDMPDVKRFLPTEWLRALRENREIALVVSLVVLALFAAGAATSGSKKRKR